MRSQLRSGRELKQFPQAKVASTHAGQPQRQQSVRSARDAHQYLAHGKPNQKVKAADLNSQFLQGLTWDETLDHASSFDSKRALYEFL